MEGNEVDGKPTEPFRIYSIGKVVVCRENPELELERNGGVMPDEIVELIYSDYDLERFIQAQAYNYYDALQEVRKGRKESCWMWYVFPQIKGLGQSSMAKKYELTNLEEAKEYLVHPVLGARLQEICEAALAIESDNARAVFGFPDDMKLRSSMTLFEQADPENPIYGKLLDKYFNGRRDEMTLQILEGDGRSSM